MVFKKVFTKLIKIIISGIISFGILTLFSMFYYNRLQIKDTDGITDNKIKPNSYYSIATEGWGRGRVNNDGYNNLFDFEADRQIDILIMGSSYMAAQQVKQEETTASLLNNLYGGGE